MSTKKKKPAKNESSNRHDADIEREEISSMQKLLPGAKIIWKDGDNKLSDALCEIAKPIFEKCSNSQEQEAIIPLAVFAWNACVLPHKEAEKLIENMYIEIYDKCSKDAVEDTLKILDLLIARKLLLFENDRRLITSYKVEKIQKGLHVAVTYSDIKT